MQHIKKTIRRMIYSLDEPVVIGSSGYELLAHPNVSPDHVDSRILGLSISFGNITRVIVPLAGGFLLSSQGARASELVSAGLMLWVIYLAFCQVVEAESRTAPLTHEVANA